jgi:hypothetical protein
MTLGNMRALRVLAASAVIPLIAVIGGCSVSPENTLYLQPGKFDLLDCASIAERSKKASERVEQLRFLMCRAGEGGPGGAVVNAIAYQDEMNTAQAQLYSLQQAADAKHCPALPARNP